MKSLSFRLKDFTCCEQVRRGYEELRKRRLDEFMSGFNTISLKLKEMYQMITLGGDAELELVDSLDPFSEVASPSSAKSPQLTYSMPHLSCTATDKAVIQG